MNITIFGANGRVGSIVMELALARGHKVTAVCRRDGQITLNAPNLKIVLADVNYPDSRIENAVAEADAVIISLGNDRHPEICYIGTENIVAAMKKSGVRFVETVTGMGASEETYKQMTLRQKIEVKLTKLFVRNGFQAKSRQDRILRDSGLEFINVEPGWMSNGAATGYYKSGTALPDAGMFRTITRPDLANFMLDNIEKKRYLCHSVLIYNY